MHTYICKTCNSFSRIEYFFTNKTRNIRAINISNESVNLSLYIKSLITINEKNNYSAKNKSIGDILVASSCFFGEVCVSSTLSCLCRCVASVRLSASAAASARSVFAAPARSTSSAALNSDNVFDSVVGFVLHLLLL